MSQTLLKQGVNATSIAHLASLLLEVDPDFPAKTFKQQATKGLNKLELKERINHIILALHKTLPEDFKTTAKLFTRLKKQWRKNDSDRYNFIAWAVTDYVGVHGIDYPKQALPVLQQLTSLFSAEFAIRPFIKTLSGACLGKVACLGRA